MQRKFWIIPLLFFAVLINSGCQENDNSSDSEAEVPSINDETEATTNTNDKA
ncbi:hypothetical protein QA612_20780 [Evansella sp. AB-P1]|uniref:hypothetical protein n=1 Tax=Evansella sp. AB-P1 TaxID=3037653 RepID=UPI00241D260B|nr:hypothetical protein [Evansella sp. AB-P1]MDG5789895.1 hypothetical protein [Evansella sp. AB-P1]